MFSRKKCFHGRILLFFNYILFAEEQDSRRVIVLEFFIRMQGDDLNLRDALVTEIEENDIFAVQRLYLMQQGPTVASGTAGVFANSDKSFIISLKSDLDDVNYAFESFCRQWDFELTALTVNKEVPRVWCKRNMQSAVVSEVDTEWHPLYVEFGKFTSQQTFECSKTFCRRVDNILDMENHLMNDEYEVVSLEFEIGSRIIVQLGSYKIYISLTDLNNFVLISIERDKLCMYVPLKYAPSLSFCGELIVYGHHTLARTVAENSVIAISFEPSCFQRLQATLSSPSIMPVPHFITRMKHEYSLDLEHTLWKTSSRVERDPRADYCVWLLRALEARRDLCVPSKSLLFFYRELQKILEEDAPKLTGTCLVFHFVTHLLAIILKWLTLISLEL